MAERASVLLLSPSAKPGGAERAFTSLAARLPACGFEPAVVLLEHGPLEGWLQAVGCDFRVIPGGRARQLAVLAGTVGRLRQVIRATSTELVLSNMAKGHLYGGLAALASGVPSVWWQQGIPERAKFEVAAAMVPSAAVVCSCEKAVEAQRRLTARRPIALVHLGIDLDRVTTRRGSGRDVRRALGWDGHKVVGIVGRLEPWKGQELFLRAAAIVARSHPDVRFAVVGGAVLGWEGDYPERLERLAHGLGLGDVVVFAGHQADVYPWFDLLDVVVHASKAEPFGLVLVEAMALGKPVVTAADGGPTEIVEDEISGLLVPPGDAGALADDINRVLDDPALASRLSAGATARAPAFSEERMAEGMATVLHDVLSERSSRRRLRVSRPFARR